MTPINKYKLLEQLIKEINSLIQNKYSRTLNYDFTMDSANIMLNEVSGNSLRLPYKGKYVLIYNYLDNVRKIISEWVQHPRMSVHWGTLV